MFYVVSYIYFGVNVHYQFYECTENSTINLYPNISSQKRMQAAKIFLVALDLFNFISEVE